MVAAVVSSCVLGRSEPAEAKPPRLGSTELQVGQCPAQSPGGPRRCAPLGGFSVIDTKTDMSDFRMVVQEDAGFQIFLEPEGCNEVRYEAPMQWRLFEDQPFAVIQVAKCLETNHAVRERKPKPARTIVVVRGLLGFEGLSRDLDASKNRGALREAVEAADRFLKAAWPRIEAERVAAAEAEAQKQEGEEGEEGGEAGAEEASAEENQALPAASRPRK